MIQNFKDIIRSDRLNIFILFFVLFNPGLLFADPDVPHVEICPDRSFQGDIALIRIDDDKKIQDLSVIINKRNISVPLDNSTGISIGLLPIASDTLPGKTNIEIILNKKIKLYRKYTVLKKDFPVQSLSLPKSQVDLSKKDLERHYKEKEIVNRVFDLSAKNRFFNSEFIMPLTGKVTTPFGVKRFINKQPKNPHSGIDLAAKKFDPVRSINKGTVVCVGDHFFAGKSVYIDHGLGVVSMYFHLCVIKVKKGDQVNTGDVIGLVGSTGRSTGPHLHWGVRVNHIKVNPLSLINLNQYL